MAKPDNTDAYRIQADMMRLTKAWPEEGSTIFDKTICGFSYSLSVSLAITMLMETFNDLSDFKKLSEILYISLTVTVYTIKYGSFYYHRESFIFMNKLLQDAVFVSYPNDMDYLMTQRIRLSRLLANAYRYLILVVIVLMAISPVFDKKPLPFPFSFELGNFRPVMFVFQAIVIGLCGWNNSTLDSLTACLIGVAATQLDILALKIKRITNGSEDALRETHEAVESKLKQCVKHHLAIMKYIDCIDEVFSFGVLLQFLGSIIVTCNTLFVLIALIPIGTSQFYMLASYLIALIAELFMYCWFGNEVMWKSLSVGEACYSCGWYDYDGKIGKYLFIIMERSKRPLIITAFKFSTLTLSAFTSIMQWTYSYFALLMKLYSKAS